MRVARYSEDRGGHVAADNEMGGIQELDLTPDPRILEVLGEIPYQPWQCLAELVDNSFDEFVSDPDRDPETPPAVHMTLPRANSGADAIVSVVDNGRGMSHAELERGLRAGYSGRVRFGSLGLFGMGFNIATARLGNRTEVKTTQVGDTHWIVAEIDFGEMQRRESFQVPLRRAEKDDLTAHGTEITVRDLNPKMLDSLKRPPTVSNVRRQLGRVYSYLLRDKSPIPEIPDTILAGRGIALYLNGKRIRPWVPCVWSAGRSVSYRGAEISAVRVVEHKLTDAYACARCGHWQRHYDVDKCTECGCEQLELRSRKVHGWLGVQRYLDPSEFGIDFLRHGRKILIDEKSLFTWENFDTGETLYEYPIEPPYSQGRLVGEIHVDHVPVLYQKTDFERASPEWRDVVLHLRGEGPMRRNKAIDRGYGENESPLGTLFKAFQENRPGLRYLTPGNGSQATHDLAREWGTRFHQGLPEYQADEKWYKAAADHDRKSSEARTHGSTKNDGGAGDLSGRTGIGPLPPPGSDQPTSAGSGDSDNSHAETEEERYARYRKQAREIHDLAGEVSVAGMGKRNVRVFETTTTLKGMSGGEVPALSRVVSGMNLEVYVNGEHPVFREYGRDPRDYAIMEIAQVLRALGHDKTQITAVAAEVTCQFPDQRTTDSALRDRAAATLRRLRDLASPIIAARAAEMWTILPNDSKATAEREAARAEPTLDWRAAARDGRFAAYLDYGSIATLVHNDPGAFLDGAVFTTSWISWSDPEARDRQVSQVIRLLETMGEFLSDPGHRSRMDLMMTRLSIDMLDQVVEGHDWAKP
jgi:hypothetical protein